MRYPVNLLLVAIWFCLGWFVIGPLLHRATVDTPQVTRDYPSYCYDRSRNFYLPCMYSSKEYRA